MKTSSQVKEVGPEICVIIGAGRSGTKFLRDVIATSNHVVAVPYDINYIWRYRNEFHPDDVLGPAQCTDAIARHIRRKLVSLSGMSPHGNKHLIVEKTVSNTLRVPFVAEILPTARYVHLVRDGRDVTESALRMWNSPPKTGYLFQKLRYFPATSFPYAIWYFKNLLCGKIRGRGAHIWGPRYPGIAQDLKTMSVLQVCAKQWVECVRHASEDLTKIPKERKLSIRYEELVSSDDTVRSLCNFLDLPNAEAVVSGYRDSLQGNTVGKWRNSLTCVQVDEMKEILAQTLEELGYH